MPSLISKLAKNPVSLYLRYLVNSFANERKFQHFHQEYMAHVLRCEAGAYVRVHDFATLVDCSVGAYSYVQRRTFIYRATIGRFCSIGPDCKIGLGTHPTRGFVSTNPAFFSPEVAGATTFSTRAEFPEHQPIEIGHDVWIGANAIIMDGVRIGTGAIIGAGAVVTKDVPPYAIYAGIPAKLLRFRFSADDIQQLLASEWWSKSDAWLRENHHTFGSVSDLMHAIDPSLVSEHAGDRS
jgi:acetyltransferase-like isoleucine patch superfamily enzyme